MDLGRLTDDDLLVSTQGRPEAIGGFHARHEAAILGFMLRRTGDPRARRRGVRPARHRPPSGLHWMNAAGGSVFVELTPGGAPGRRERLTDPALPV
jgi:hypothetical protein